MDIREQKRKDRFNRNFVKVSKKMLEHMNESFETPIHYEFFYNQMESVFVNKIEWDEKPVVGTFCAMVPEELIMAAEGLPVRLCGGNYIAQIAGDEFGPRDSCPVVKSVIGGFDQGLLPAYEKCQLAIVPTSCDGKKKMAEILANYVPTVPLHIPALKDETAFEDVVPLYMGLIPVIEEVTGHKITRKKLKEAIQLNQRINLAAYELMSFKKMKPSVVYGTQVLLAMNAYQYSDRKTYLKNLEALNAELKEKVKRNETIADKSPRILLTGSPIVFPNMKLPLALESLGAVVVADETCAGDRMLADPVYVNDDTIEGMVRALAVKYVLPCSCPTFAYNEERLFRLKQMVKEYQVDGIIYHVLRGCLPYDFEVRNVEALSKELGVPVLRVETDYNTEDLEPMKIRLEAFTEMLKMR